MPSSSRFLATIRGLLKHKSKTTAVNISARELRPIKSELPSLAQLPYELILRIVEFVGEVSPESLDDIGLVCSFLYEKVSAVRHRHVSLSLTDEAVAHDRIDLISRSDCLSTVRTLRVVGGKGLQRSGSSPVLPLIVSALPKMTGLCDMYWTDSIIPKQLLEQLRQRPKVQLHVQMSTSDLNYRTGPGALPSRLLLESLKGCLNLVSLRVELLYTTAIQCLETIIPLKYVLLSCPHLSILDLDISPPQKGCTPIGPLTEYVGLGFHGGERPPPLEELRAIRYPLGHKQGKGNTPFDYEGYPSEKAEADYWADTFDWSRLRRLHDIPPELAHKLAPKLTLLKHLDLTIHWHWSGFTLADLLSALPAPLESIHLPSPLAEAPFAALISHHGATLRSLSLTSPETWAGDFPSGVLSASHLLAMRDGMPHLESLALDVRRAGQDWPHDILAAAATFPRLRRLELRFELGAQSRTPVRPYLTAAAAMHMTGYLERRAGTALRHLRLVCGGPPYRVDQDNFSGIGETPGWSRHCSTSFECEAPTEHLGQRIGRAPFRIRCEKLTRVLNERLWRVAQGEEEVSFPKVDARWRLDFKVALQGPLSMQDYDAWRRMNNK